MPSEITALPSVFPAAPGALLGLAPLMRMALANISLNPLAEQLLDRAKRDAQDAYALMDLSVALQMAGNRELALAMQAQALQMQQLYHQPAACGQPRLRLLVIKASGDLMANTPVECLLEGTDISVDHLYLGPGLPLPDALPDHDLAFVAISESVENQPLLQEIEALPAFWPRPVVKNFPEQIRWLSRDGVYARLRSAPGLAMPANIRVSREVLEQASRNERLLESILPGDGPVIIRPVDSHAGHSLDKLDDIPELADYLRQTPGEQFYLARFVDYRSADGQYRKYRIVLIKGQPYAGHMAISDHWMIHYLNAGMAESAAKRDEEARFMETFDTGFARRHALALEAIFERMQLDYLGIDCGEAADGRLLIFEVDSSMVVHAMDPVDLFPYKQPHMRKLFSAFRDLLAQVAGQRVA